MSVPPPGSQARVNKPLTCSVPDVSSPGTERSWITVSCWVHSATSPVSGLVSEPSKDSRKCRCSRFPLASYSRLPTTDRLWEIRSSVPSQMMPDGSSTTSGSLKARLQEMWFPTRKQLALNCVGTGGFNVLGSMDAPAAAPGGARDTTTATAARAAQTAILLVLLVFMS